MDNEKISQLRKKFNEAPGSDAFVELAKVLLESSGTRAEAREVCFQGLHANPASKLGRLFLARAFYLDGLYNFAARELAELQGQTSSPALVKLLDEFGPLAAKYRSGRGVPAPEVTATPIDDEEGVVAEMDLDAGLLEIMEDIENE